MGDETPKKKQRLSAQCYIPDYTREWPVIERSKLSPHHAFCKLCNTDFTVSHGGRSDVDKHVRSNKHEAYKSSVEKTRPVNSYFPGDRETSVINAEVLCVDFLVEHNIPM